jgi:hypothetical protein
MPISQSGLEEAVFQALLPKLEAEGFQVFLHPSPAMLPPFMQNLQPDAVAMKPDRKIAIEVTPAGRQAESKLRRLQALFSNQPDWELRVVYAPPRTDDADISVASKAAVLETLDRLLRIFDDAGPLPALLTGWSVFEAAARNVIPDNLGRPQQPSRLIELLASGGYVTPDEAASLRRLGRLRNQAAHGRLDVPLTRPEIEDLVTTTRALLATVAESPALGDPAA